MEYTVATNWDPKLLDLIDYPEVKSVFGALPNTPVSGGRSSLVIKSLTDKDVKDYIKKVHEKGWNFSYNINTSCTGNKELTADGYKKIRQYFDWICDLGVDSVTVAIPNLLNIIKKYYSHLTVKISTFQKINSVSMAKHYEDMGADAIMLSEHVNRDIKLIKSLRENLKCKLVLLANTGCIYGCPNMFAHANSIAHSGANSTVSTVFTESYVADCSFKRIKNIDEIAKIRWIRPEDINYYENIGIDMLKIIDRHSSTEALGERMKAYNDRCYDGNLLNLLGQMMNRKKSKALNLKGVYRGSNVKEMKKSREFISDVFQISVSDLYYFDNKKIPEDFIQGFEKRDCDTLSCEKCGYCKKIVDMAVCPIVEKEEITNAMERLVTVKEKIISGSILY